IIFALNPPGMLVEMVIDLAYPLSCSLLPIFLGALFWRRATKIGAIISLSCSLITVVLTTMVWPDALNIYSGLWSIVVGVPILVVVSLLSKPNEKDTLDRFHGPLSTEMDPGLGHEIKF